MRYSRSASNIDQDSIILYSLRWHHILSYSLDTYIQTYVRQYAGNIYTDPTTPNRQKTPPHKQQLKFTKRRYSSTLTVFTLFKYNAILERSLALSVFYNINLLLQSAKHRVVIQYSTVNSRIRLWGLQLCTNISYIKDTICGFSPNGRIPLFASHSNVTCSFFRFSARQLYKICFDKMTTLLFGNYLD